MCSYSDAIGKGVDRVLSPYEECSFELTKREFERNNDEPILLYVDTPRSMHSFIETCQTGGQQLCDTEEFRAGVDYSFKYDPNWAVRIIFENDDSEDATFQIEYSTAGG